MGVTTGLQNVTGVPQANYFELVHYDISNRGTGVGGAVLNVWWNAYLRSAREPTQDDASTYALRLAKECGPETFSGPTLQALCADADERAQGYKGQGASAGMAYALGQRDAVYAALQSCGAISVA